MINFIANWQRRFRFQLALKQGNFQLSQQLLLELQRNKVSLTPIEKLFQDKLKYEAIATQNEREVIVLREQIGQNRQVIETLSREKQQFEQFLTVLHPQLKYKEQEFVSIQQLLAIQVEEVKTIQRKISQSSPPVFKNLFLEYNFDLICFVEQQFKLKDIDEHLIQSTGIDADNFFQLESDLFSYLQSEFTVYPHQQLKRDLKATYEKDIIALKQGKDPDYSSYLTPHVYFMVYFLEGVYSAYLAWFLVYQSGLLPTKCNILDIGAGSGAMLYGLNFFLKRAGEFLSLPQIHISYCSLEIRNLLQHHGLEFWRQYIELNQPDTINAYFRLKTFDLFSYGSQNDTFTELPQKFFDFVSISHCIFADKERRINSHKVYKSIFTESLKDNGYVLIVVQGRKLHQAYNQNQSESLEREKQLIQMFLDELGLKLKWYTYVSSTSKRIPASNKSEFARFARESLPDKKYMNKLLRQYFGQKYDENYVLDDYVILAKKL